MRNTGAAFDMAILQRRHGAKATVTPFSTSKSATTFFSSIGSANERLNGSEVQPAWRPAQYLWPRTLSLRRGEARPLTVYYPNEGLLPQAERQKVSAQEAVLTIETVTNSKTGSGVR